MILPLMRRARREGGGKDRVGSVESGRMDCYCITPLLAMKGTEMMAWLRRLLFSSFETND